MRVAVVDDYEDLVKLIEAVLEYQGVEVKTLSIDLSLFTNEVWEAVDAAVVDLSMPISGLAVLGYLQTNHPGIHRVACSALADLRVKAEDFAHVVLAKPFHTKDLMEAVTKGVTA